MASKTKSPVPPDAPDRIKALRNELGLTQTRLAELLSVSFASVNRWENGQTRPTELAWRQITKLEQFGLEGLKPGHAKECTESYSDAAAPDMDFISNPEHVWLLAEGERLTYGHMFNPAYAIETALIDPLPHQRIAVYDRMLHQPRLRFLLADDAGAGKTIMTGLYIREMLSRRLIRRVLIVPPAGLLGNWERELRTLFGLHFRIVDGADARKGNPFLGSGCDRVVVSVDTLSGDKIFKCLQDPAVVPYDLVVFDECHKLSVRQEPDGGVRKTDRYRLGESLAGAQTTDPRWQLPWHANHLLLLSATPHMGKDYPYYALWRLLEPDIFATEEALIEYPQKDKQRHFIRRTKEEMVTLEGNPLYPIRKTDTLSYDLAPGAVSEQALYDQVTDYIRTYYNKAKILNRSAARFAMSVFQRRLASSTWAILRSLERRAEKLHTIIEDIQSGRISEDELRRRQGRLDAEDYDALDARTADEESTSEGQEESDQLEDKVMNGVVALSLAELLIERNQVRDLTMLARRVYDSGQESKFDKLRSILDDPERKNEKVLIFTEHRDTLDYLINRLSGIGYAGRVAKIHGGMDYKRRDEQKELFKRDHYEGGAQFLIATDAAGEGINLQFCWIMVNFDIPWNPARLEQRMGRIHRYGQKHDPVIILNLVAGKTREGRVMKILLEKLESIRKSLGSDKVFDVIGRLFEGVSVREYMERALEGPDADDTIGLVEGTLTEEQVKALEDRERRLYGDGGDVKKELPAIRESLEREQFRRLLPGFVRRYVERAAPMLGIGIDGETDSIFSLRPDKPGAMDALWTALDAYTSQQREQISFYRPVDGDLSDRIWLHPGDHLFDTFRQSVTDRFRQDALHGAVFVDPTADAPYLMHLGLVRVERKSDPAHAPLAHRETLECRLVALRQFADGRTEECPVEHFMLLKGARGIPPAAQPIRAKAPVLAEKARAHAAGTIAVPLAEHRRATLRLEIPSREEFIRRGFDYQDAELASRRTRLSQRVRDGVAAAKKQLDDVKLQQRHLAARKADALAVLHREPELVEPGAIEFLAHALVVPTTDPAERERFDKDVEAIAVQIATAYDESRGATVRDVSKPELARACGLDEKCGFDLHVRRGDSSVIAVEVKGRMRGGEIELTDNEWSKACNLRKKYWLYVVYDCATANPRLVRVQDPFGKLVTKGGGVVINAGQVYAAAEIE
ncbi:MAG: DUF3883 domain-containing protein [Candidatus Hydrogenedentes bacterium]|nr:DUF3883 domain-containing protein [Candidatus Hydrogenedentota bacterium]